MTAPLPPLVACVDSSAEIAGLLAEVFASEGFRAATHVSSSGVGAGPVAAFLRRVQPSACVYAIEPPYRERWAEFESLRRAYPACVYVLTTTHKPALDELVGPVAGIEVVGKPFDLDDIIAAVCRALAAG